MAGSFSFASIDDERTARAALTYVAPPEDAVTDHVLRVTGSGLSAIEMALRNDPIPGVGRSAALLWRRRFDVADLDRIADGFEQGRALGLHVLVPDDLDWPESLGKLGAREPYALWVKGDTSLLGAPVLSRAALIGAYAPTDYGTEWALRTAAELTQDGYVVTATSGTGIAAEATRGALLEGGHPVVVVPRPLSFAGPDSAAVARQGLLVSELPPHSPHSREAGRASHRLLAAMSGVVTVVEAHERSTPVRTAEMARTLGREVAAVPSDVTRLRRGTNALIAEGIATLITEAEDVEHLLEKHLATRLLLDVDRQAPARAFDHSSGLAR
ncbi:DNA-processing protein DprA [Leucobacter ruminantium]|uniref:DNA-processing protein DprA n=1 Tax=Leucobacter ruminantium TaxID=1289170 RepID=A0A939M0T2_9MICO|nr:DNA-processing protein DprA [Leucobacter ruminantium]MBO1806628.1 DNA-processing protein DprA [Leucobacter ruminantium]